MSLITSIPFTLSANKISHSDGILTLGSCFANNMGDRLSNHFFNCQKNPFGIIYHPLVLLNGLKRIQKGTPFNDLVKNGELWHSWDHHSSFSHPQKESALAQMNAALNQAHRNFAKLDWLFLTFGTAYGYHLQDNNQLVANCHKYPGQTFTKKLSDGNQLIAAYDEYFTALQKVNPDLRIVLTVSPIRHLKDGLIANNRSKARLLLLAEYLEQKFSFCQYFPAYEFMLDELRDYRFYKKDLLHPSPLAQDYIWDKLSTVYFSAPTQKLNQQIDRLQKAAAHRPLFPGTRNHQDFLQQQLKKVNQFEASNPTFNLDNLKDKFRKQLI